MESNRVKTGEPSGAAIFRSPMHHEVRKLLLLTTPRKQQVVSEETSRAGGGSGPRLTLHFVPREAETQGDIVCIAICRQTDSSSSSSKKLNLPTFALLSTRVVRTRHPLGQGFSGYEGEGRGRRGTILLHSNKNAAMTLLTHAVIESWGHGHQTRAWSTERADSYLLNYPRTTLIILKGQ